MSLNEKISLIILKIIINSRACSECFVAFGDEISASRYLAASSDFTAQMQRLSDDTAVTSGTKSCLLGVGFHTITQNFSVNE